MTSASLPVPVGRELFQRMAWQERAACVTSLALIGVLVAPVPSALRLIVALAFVVVAPGTALLAIAGSSLFGTSHPGLIVALGLAQIILLGEIALWAHAFYPRPELAAFAAAAFAIVVIAVYRRVHPSPSGVQDGSDPSFALFIPPGVASAFDAGGINLLPATPGPAAPAPESGDDSPEAGPGASDAPAAADDVSTGVGEGQPEADGAIVDEGSSADPEGGASTPISDAAHAPGAIAATPTGDADAPADDGHVPTEVVEAPSDASAGSPAGHDPTTDSDSVDDDSGGG